VGVIGRDVLQEKRPDTYGPGVRLIACSLQQELTRGVKPALLAILGAAFLVLLIACVNVTNLLLSRGVQRRGEFAMRAALGASKARLTRQLLTECLVLALLGGVLGLLVAAFGTHALIALSPADLPRSNAIGVDRAVFAFAFCITSLIGIAFGLVPAQQASHSNLRDSLEQSTHRTARQHTRARKLLVVGEVALALVLLVSSGLLWRSLERLFAVDVGFDPSQILTMQIQLSGNNFQNHEQIDPFFAQIIQSVQQVPGVTSAALTSQLPLSGDLDEYGVSFEATPNQPTETFNSFRYAVSPVYIQTMRISLLSGRSLNANDREATPFVALISESLAKLRFGHRDPIGNRLRIGPMDGVPYTIVGVVKDIKQMSLAASESSAVYIPASQWPFPDKTMSIVARTSNPQRANGASVPHAELSAFRQAIWSVDKNQPISRVATMDELLAATAAERRFSLILFEAFALAALVLAAAGIYGVLAGSVAERTREIGVRSALGASRMGIVAMILRQGITLTGIGIVIGVIGAAVVTQAIIAMLFQVSHLDLFTYLGVIALLTLVAAIASAVPAYRASLVDPANTLRAQ
jgi:putative ABC transport system permease protein